MGAFYPTPGYCDELMVFFRLTGLAALRTPAAPDDDEVLEPSTFALEEARRLAAGGGVMDMKTVLGLRLV